jgi:Domain of unknown function (DUF4440)
MIKYFLMLVLSSLITLNSFSQKHNKKVPEPKYFVSLLNKKFDFFLQKDTSALNQLLHDSLVYIHSSGKMDTKKELANGLFTTSNPYKKFNVYNELVRTINANTVIVHAIVEIKYSNETQNSKLLITEVYTKTKKQWQLISRHANKNSK